MTVRPTRSPTIEAMKADREGRAICICCDEKLPAGRSVTCGDGECITLYSQIWMHDRKRGTGRPRQRDEQGRWRAA